MGNKVWHWRTWPLNVALIAGVFLGASRCQTVPIDSKMSASEGGAATVVLCGMGECRRGMLFVQKQIGSATTAPIELKLVKRIGCDRDACVRFQVFNPDGSQGFSGSIPNDEEAARFTLGDVIQSDEIRLTHDNEWLFKVVVFFKDSDGVERRTYGFAFIRVNAVSEEYEMLSCGDPETAWRVELKKDCEVHYSSGFRSAQCGHGCIVKR